MSNKHLPTDIDSMSRKDLIELYHIQVEEHQKILKELEQQQAEIGRLTQERDRFRAAIDDECLNWQFTVDEENPRESMRQLLNITATIARDPNVCEEAANFALEQQLKGVEDALKNIPETRHGNWPMALVRKYVIDMRQKVKNGGNDD